jgi:hypothetical protein
MALRKKQAIPKGAEDSLVVLKQAYKTGRLTLYLGAGVSMASGLPSWSALLATLYYTAVNADWEVKWKPFPNYLYAIGEWWLKQSGEAPEVIAGKVHSYLNSESSFHQNLWDRLYLPWINQPPSAADLRKNNSLLRSVAELCESTNATNGLHAVVTTNYDSLLEQSLSDRAMKLRFKPVWRRDTELNRKAERGIFHVHGYIPYKGTGSKKDDILLTESQYHKAASDPYSWSNLTLIQCFSSSIGLMVGMSMTDRNLRRLLYALSQTQLRQNVYLVLKETEKPKMTRCDIKLINENATKYAQQFSEYGFKKEAKAPGEIQEVLGELVLQEKAMTEKALKRFGVTVIWVTDHAEVPVIVEALRASPQ